MLVDTHCHVSRVWYEPVEALLARMDGCGVERAWLVQLLGEYDNDYQQACRRSHRDRLVSIVGVDWTEPSAPARLERLADDGAAGVRLRPASRAPEGDPLALWRIAAERGLVVSCVGTAAQFAEPGFAALLDEIPAATVILEHLGGLARPDVGDRAAALPAILGLARHANVRLKLPGLGQLLARPELSPPPADLDDPRLAPIAAAIAAFGPERLLWASDFPVVSSREGYANALNWTRGIVPLAARGAIFGGNANRLLEPSDQRRRRA